VERSKDTLVKKASKEGGLQIVSAVLPVDPAAAKDLAFKVKQAIGEDLLFVLGSHHEGKPLLTVMIGSEAIESNNLHAGQMIREAAKLIKGGGGGQPHFATAGGKDTDGLSAAVDKIVQMAIGK
jgi:alanyl-tRNA synthetase